MSAASELYQLHLKREAEGRPHENLAELLKRVRYAAEWNQSDAASKAEQSRGFYAMSKDDERYTTVQREDALYSAAALQGESNIRRDAARTLDSIADALVAIIG